MGRITNFSNIINQVQNSLIHMKSVGFSAVDCSKSSLALVDGWSRGNITNKSKSDTLVAVNSCVENCKRCGLSKYRNNIVFGEGHEDARLVFVGEGPGVEEDKTGRPFVGKAGQLLTRIIEAMGLRRENVYICNIVKCRPPSNRNPNDKEIMQCLPFLKRQIFAISPEIICLLGAVACKSFLNTKATISNVRGRFTFLNDMEHIRVMPTYHPAYLLRNPEKKRDVWEDMQKIMMILK